MKSDKLPEKIREKTKELKEHQAKLMNIAVKEGVNCDFFTRP